MPPGLSIESYARHLFAAFSSVKEQTDVLHHPSRTAPLSFAAVAACIILVAINLRPAIVSIGSLLP